ncbi:hypothetical protein KCP73_05850 [Salmonella enterica subsp. enterica]|nr:hypothetical protein KCP73_05850 [Salmonella enterica subsp. enterica]
MTPWRKPALPCNRRKLRPVEGMTAIPFTLLHAGNNYAHPNLPTGSLGQNCKSRAAEHSVLFSDRLLETAAGPSGDAAGLAVAGDIFDTGSPPSWRLRTSYNRFVVNLQQTGHWWCWPNRDSVATLNERRAIFWRFTQRRQRGLARRGYFIVVRRFSGRCTVPIPLPARHSLPVRRDYPASEKQQQLLHAIADCCPTAVSEVTPPRRLTKAAGRATGHKYRRRQRKHAGSRHFAGTLDAFPAARLPRLRVSH